MAELVVPDGHKFACIALDVWRDEAMEHATVLQPGLTAHFHYPFDGIGAHWHDWLGSLLVKQFTQAHLYLMATSPSTALEVLNDENQGLMWHMRCLFMALGIHGVRIHQEAILVSGSRIGSETPVRTVHRFQPYYPLSEDEHAFPLDAARLHAIFQTSRTLYAIYAQPTHDRLKRGINALLTAATATDVLTFLHQSVRAMEALMMPDEGKTRKQFKSRGSFIASFDGDTHAKLEELFNMRSAAEHMNDFTDLLQSMPKEQRQEYVAHRMFEAEVMATEAYKHVLTHPALLDHFETDGKLHTFWALPEMDRRIEWGQPFDVSACVRARVDAYNKRWED